MAAVGLKRVVRSLPTKRRRLDKPDDGWVFALGGQADHPDDGPLWVDLIRHAVGELPLFACAVRRRRFPVGESPTRRTLQPEATGAVMEVTKWLKPSV